MNAPFGDRLKKERDRLGLSQDDFAALGGVKPRAYWNYEKGNVAPDADFLARLCDKGIDVLYVVSGSPSLTVAEAKPAEYINPARVVAGEIAGMRLSSDDAELLLALARRLCPPG